MILFFRRQLEYLPHLCSSPCQMIEKLQRKPTSLGCANLFNGISSFIIWAACSLGMLFLCAFFSTISLSLSVCVAPGNILLTVTPKGPSSDDKVLLQFATAPRIVFDTPRPGIGCFTDVEIILIILPNCFFLNKGATIRQIVCAEIKCCRKARL